MRHFVVPAKFFESIAGKGNLYSRFWMYWLGEFVDEIFNEDFVEKQVKLLSKHKVKESEIREIYQFGVQFLQPEFKIIEPKKKRAVKPVSKEVIEIAQKVIDYLNEKTGATFQAKGENLKLISERLSDGFTISDFFVVIDKKVADWKGNDYQKFLRPLTLFAKTKFENYLNSIDGKKHNNFSKLSDSVNRAKELIGVYN